MEPASGILPMRSGTSPTSRRPPDGHYTIDWKSSGHTDAVGTSECNQTLSQRSATAAVNYLMAQGVGPARLRAVGRGETEPIATNDTEAGRQANRRIEIAIVANAATRAL